MFWCLYDLWSRLKKESNFLRIKLIFPTKNCTELILCEISIEKVRSSKFNDSIEMKIFKYKFILLSFLELENQSSSLNMKLLIK